MNQNTDNHIRDEFLKKLVAMQQVPEVSDDFTQRVMKGLPKAAEAPAETVKKIDLRLVAIVVAVATVVIALFFSFDCGSIFTAIEETSGNDPAKYFNLITSISTSFGNAFSGIRISSISIAALVALVLLYLADSFINKWFASKAESA
jgi:multisubunit Na+/H+ antiporter MnhB subunit